MAGAASGKAGPSGGIWISQQVRQIGTRNHA
jgi:hypothetical protein